MNEYVPNRWVVLKLTNNGEVTYKVLASWYGSFTQGDSWKLNSGITQVESLDDNYLFHGYSGSVYVCNKQCYGLSGIMSSILWSWQNSADQTEGVSIEVMPEDTNFLEIDYE